MGESESRSTVSPAPPFWASLLVCAFLVVVMGFLRLAIFRNIVLPVGYGVPLVISAWTRSRRLLWGMAIIFLAMTVVKFFFLIGADSSGLEVMDTGPRLVSFGMIFVDLAAITVLVDVAMRNRRILEEQAVILSSRNDELSARREEIARQNTELQRQAEELDLRRRHAEEESIRKSRFLAAVSHDIRTPANAISLLAELIQRTAADPESASEIPELAMELQNCSLSLVGLIGDVLDLTRLDAGRIDLHESEIDFNKFLTDECRQLQPLADEKKLEFECIVPSVPRQLRVDRIKLSRIVTNLIANAIKFTDQGHVRVLGAISPDGGVQISVQDSGIGIPAEHIERIFDEYYQLKNPGRDRVKGTGLGLSISRRLIGIMGGSLEVQSEPAKGSTFTVTLPAGRLLP
jgi:signal transduction histidine kinase